MNLFRNDFLWGAATSPHQTEGNNVNSDWWAREGQIPGMEISGDALDSYHRYPEDMRLLAEAGLNSYRFGIEWARIEPRPGQISRAELTHYRRMIDTSFELGLTPVVTLFHFSTPRWFAEQGGWAAPTAIDNFVRYASAVTDILGDVPWVATINEPNMMAMVASMMDMAQQGDTSDWQSPTIEGGHADHAIPAMLPTPSPTYGQLFIDAHHAVREVVRRRTNAKVGWTVANQAFTSGPEHRERLEEIQYDWEDRYLEAARGDDFIGVQAYSSQAIDADGVVPHPQSPTNTLVGTAYRPDALEMAVRHSWEVTREVPILVTENGIATDDDTRRIAYTDGALRGLASAIEDGVDVRGYLHWSALDNYEWGHWTPTFGLISVDRSTFDRHPKPSLGWLGRIAKQNGAQIH